MQSVEKLILWYRSSIAVSGYLQKFSPTVSTDHHTLVAETFQHDEDCVHLGASVHLYHRLTLLQAQVLIQDYGPRSAIYQSPPLIYFLST
mgnify:CR=1 FL=1